MTKLDQLFAELSEIESDNTMDYLEKMKLTFHIKDLIAEEEMKQFLEEMEK
jgi:hypothetical protein